MPGTARGVPEPDRAGRGHEGLRIFGVDAALDGVAADLDVALGVRQGLAGGDEELGLDEVDAGHELGDRMLDLDAGVHFNEIELVVLIEELERAGVAVTDLAAGPRRSDRPWSCAACAVMPGRRGLFDHFLVAALHGAVALAQVDHVAVVVGEHLELDVARLLEEFLHVDLGVAEGGERLGLGDADRVQQRGVGVHDAHAAAAAAARCLDDHRVADILGDAEVFVRILAERAVGPGHAGHAGCLHDLDRRDLVAHEADGLRARADEDEAALLDPLGEIRVLRQKAVARDGSPPNR